MALPLKTNYRSLVSVLVGLVGLLTVNVVQAQDINCGDGIVPNWPEDKDISIPVYTCTAPVGAIVTPDDTKNFLTELVNGSDVSWNLYFAVEPDFEKEQSVMVTLTASNSGGLSESKKVEESSVQLLIILEDAPDNYPLFQTEATINLKVPENEPSTSLVSLSVTDADESTTYGLQSVHLSFEDPSMYDVFTISEPVISGSVATVEIGLQSTLDFETMSVYNLLVLAEDGGGLNQTATIIINVMDAEDTPPYFTNNSPYTSILEDTPVGTLVFTVKGQDGDRQLNYPVTYSITSGNIGDAFAIDETTGNVTIAVPLDRDTGTALYTLIIRVTESGDHTDDVYVADTTCTVSLEDVDNSPPTFTLTTLTASIFENSANGYAVTFDDGQTLTINDLDLGNNAIYNVTATDDSGIFTINPLAGQNQQLFSIQVKDKTNLDYEKIESVVVTVVATDLLNPVLVSTATVTVAILDQDDVKPNFLNTSCVDVPETADVGTEICYIMAHDGDSAQYSTFVYGASYGQLEGIILIDPVSGIISVIAEGMDYELYHSYVFSVSATDNNGQGEIVTQPMTLTVIDTNDNPPKFTQTAYTGIISEDASDFYIPLVVQANDADSGENAEIVFDIIECGDRFNISDPSVEGKMYSATIMPTVTLDFEALVDGCQNPSQGCPIFITVRAMDLGDPPLDTNVTVTATVMDANDNAPEFVQPLYETTIDETALPGSSVIQVSATDADYSKSYNTIQYRLDNDGPANFQIDQGSGQITVAPKANLKPEYNDPPKYNFTLIVTADDGGQFSNPLSTSTVIVNINDIDNQPPQFDNTRYTGDATENTDGPVVTVTATDVDYDAYLQYSIDYSLSLAYSETNVPVTDPKLERYFGVDVDTGTIVVNCTDSDPLDRETMQTVVLYLMVTDINTESGVDSDNTQVTITVQDLNDNEPKFTSNSYTGSVPENAVNATITMNTLIQATDADLTPNNIINYFIVSQSPEVGLIMEPTMGSLKLDGTFIDHEAVSVVTVIIQAIDGGNPPLSSTATVTVNVIDANDSQPHFDETSYVMYLPEDSEDFDGDHQVHASDNDTAGDFGTVWYSFSPNVPAFKIEQLTGIISVLQTQDYESSTKTISLTVQGCDNDCNPENSYKSTTQVTINIEDVNDEYPKFLNLPEVVECKEDLAVGQRVTTVTAVDLDGTGPNNEVHFDISSGSGAGYFQIDNDTGIVTPSASLINLIAIYELNITACDGGEGPLCTSDLLTINVTDINNNPPTITLSPNEDDYHYTQPENTTDYVTTISWDDQDIYQENKASAANQTAKCTKGSYDGSDTSEYFSISEDPDSNSAVLSASDMDVETCSEHKITITVYNTDDTPGMSSSVDIIMDVIPVDEYPPQFDCDQVESDQNCTQTVHFLEAQAAGYTYSDLLTVIDRDLGGDGTINNETYYCFIIGGTNSEYFLIDRDNCSITTNSSTLDVDYDSSTYVVFAAVSLSEHQPSTVTDIDKADPTQLLINIILDDINDNPPKFLDAPLYGGVDTSYENGDVVSTITATDVDVSDQDDLVYSITDQEVYVTHMDPDTDPFTINSETGDIMVAATFEDGMEGYVTVFAHAFDGKYTADATVTINVISAANQLICSSSESSDMIKTETTDFSTDFTSEIGGYQVVVDKVQTHYENNEAIGNQSDIYVHILDKIDFTVLSGEEAYSIVSDNMIAIHDGIYVKYKIFQIVLAVPTANSTDDGITTYIMAAVIGVLAIVSILVLGIALFTNSRMRRKLKAATATAFGSQHSGLNRVEVPNTNLHMNEGSNPVYSKGQNGQVNIAENYDGVSDTSDDIDNAEDFQGGEYNPNYQQRIENLFANLDDEGYQKPIPANLTPTYEQLNDKINHFDNFDSMGSLPGSDKPSLNGDEYNPPGNNRPSFDNDGYNSPGNNRPSFDNDVYNPPGSNRVSLNDDGSNPPGNNRPSFDNDGYNSPGNNRVSLNEDGYNPPGSNRDSMNDNIPDYPLSDL